MEIIREEAPAKINLTLSVIGRRADGYHTLDTVMHSVTLADAVTLAPAETLTLEIEGAAPAGRENLMWRAAERFFAETGLPCGAAMHLAKRIPSEAGLGGGSADAAAVLRGLRRMTGADISDEALCRIGASLGADIPFCIMGGAARCGGIGDELAPLPAWEGLPLLIVRPAVSVSTPAAYREIDRLTEMPPRTSDAMARALAARDLPLLVRSLANDFEAAMLPALPALQAAACELRALGLPALMTGSGSAFFLIAEGDARKKAKEVLAAAHPDWFLAEAETRGRP